MNIKAQFGQIFESELLAEIEAKAKFIKKHEDDVLLDTGEIIRTIPLVVSGSLKIIQVSDKEKELLLYYIGAGGTCVMTLTCCMERHPSEIRAIAENDVLLFRNQIRLIAAL